MSGKDFFDRVTRALESGQGEVDSEQFSRVVHWAIRKGVTSPASLMEGLIKESVRLTRESLLQKLPEGSEAHIRELAFRRVDGKMKFNFTIITSVYDIAASYSYLTSNFLSPNEEDIDKLCISVMQQTLLRICNSRVRMPGFLDLVEKMGFDLCKSRAYVVVSAFDRYRRQGPIFGESSVISQLREYLAEHPSEETEYRRLLAEQRASASVRSV